MKRATGSDGYVTLAVLIMAGLLAALVSTLLTLARPALDLTRLGADQVASEGLLDGGLAAAGYLLFAAQQTPDTVDGMSFDFDSGDVRLVVADENSRMDLNTTDPMLLEGLFSAAKGTSMSAAAFAARVSDWRDEDEDLNQDGAETDAYSSAGLAYGPRNGPFETVGELRFLLGLSAQDFSRLEPLLTVFNSSGLIDPFSASETVLRAVPDLPQADLEKLLKARGASPEAREALLAELVSASEWFLAEPSGVYRVTVTAELPSGLRDGIEAVVTAPGDETSDFGVVAWSKLPSAAP